MESKRLETAYGPVAYRVRPGAGSLPLVLLHGRAADSTQWDGVVPLLAVDAPLVLVDLPCHGASRAYEGFYYDRAADHVAEIMRLELARPALLVGHSIGGAVAQALAVRYPDAASGLLVADAAPLDARAYSAFDRFALKRSATSLRVYEERSVRGLAGGMAKELAATAAGREALHEIFARTDALGLCRLVSLADGELVRYVERMAEPQSPACPLFLACGARDRLNKTRRAMRAWAQRSGVPLRELEGCGHFCMLDDPAAFARAVAAFADDLPGARASC